MITAKDYIDSNTEPTHNKDVLALKDMLSNILDKVAKRIEDDNEHNGSQLVHEQLRAKCVAVCHLAHVLLKDRV